MNISTRKSEAAIAAFLIFSTLCALVWSYYVGLSGPFLFDDFPNLERLGLLNGGVTWESLSAYLNAGVAGPVGRPISLLTFMLNAADWPVSAWSFKYTNVLIHALNALLVFWFLLLVLSRVLGASGRVALAAGLLAALWALSPYHVSTVLYVVQRMAMLSALFVLLGMVLYFKGRLLLEEKRLQAGGFVILMSYIVGAGLGVLSKENAALFVLIVPLMEWVFFSRKSLDPGIRRALGVVVVVPAVVFVLAMAAQWPTFSEDYKWFRDFSLLERLLTQARALGYYLWRYLVPGTEYYGIYGDTFGKSTGLLTPASTLAWTLVHGTLLVIAIKMRKKVPLLAFGVLFFYVAHSMESSIVPLELFFEHRNYLPSAFLLAPLAVFVNRRAVVLMLAGLIVINGAFLRAETTRWSDSLRFYTSTVERMPASERAAVGLAEFHMRNDDFQAAVDVVREFRSRHAMDISSNLALITAACHTGDIRQEDVDALIASPRQAREAPWTLHNVGFLARRVRDGECPGLELADLQELMDVYVSAFDRGPKDMHAYHRTLAELAFMSGNIVEAGEHGLTAISIHPDINFSSKFCGALVQSGAATACECVRLSSDAFERGYKKTLVRSVLDYIGPRREAYLSLRQRLCPDDGTTSLSSRH